MQTIYRNITFVSLFSLVAACGGEDRAVDFAVDGDKKLRELTVSELKSICVDASSAVLGELSVQGCTLVGLGASASGESCEAARDDCLVRTQSQFDAQAICQDVDAKDVARLQGCEVTVGEYEVCANALLSSVSALLGGISCNSSPEELTRLSSGLQVPAVCRDLEARCPGMDLDPIEASGGGLPFGE